VSSEEREMKFSFILLYVCLNISIAASIRSIRPLGAYERLLSRKVPMKENVALSHGCAVLLNGVVDDETLERAVMNVMDKHPMLKVYIDGDNWTQCASDVVALVKTVLQPTVYSNSTGSFDSAWKFALETSMNGATFPVEGPLWKVQSFVHEEKTAWVFTMNHGIDDQQSVNIMVNDMISSCISKGIDAKYKCKAFPPSIEQAIAPEFPGMNTLLWGLFQISNLAARPIQIPNFVYQRMIDGECSSDTYYDPDKRRTILDYFILNKDKLGGLRRSCKANSVTITQALAAAMLCTTAETVVKDVNNQQKINLRFLLSVGLRPYGQSESGNHHDFTNGTVACAGGAIDFIISLTSNALHGDDESFWDLARSCRREAESIIQHRNFIPESVRLFDFGMTYAKVLQIVEADSRSKGTLGRGFSCGVSNVGLCNFMGDDLLQVDQVYYGTSHSRNGVLCQLSVESVKSKGILCGCLQMTDPLLTRMDQMIFKNKLLNLLDRIC
jgi:hypothetical protein